MRASAVKIMRGNSSSSSSSAAAAALLAMMVMMMTMFITKTNCFSINQTITISSTWCDGRNDDDPSCFIGETDLDSDEFMLDSDFSRRILAGTTDNHLTSEANNAKKPVMCDREGPGKPSCLPDKSYGSGKKDDHCNEEVILRGCNRIPAPDA